MVRNAPSSLRNSTSSLSLRPSPSAQSLRSPMSPHASVQEHEHAARLRIAQLEAQVAALQARETAQTPYPGCVPVTASDAQTFGRAQDYYGTVNEGEDAVTGKAPLGSIAGSSSQRADSAQLLGLRGLDGQEQSAATLFERYNDILMGERGRSGKSLITKGLVREGNALKSPEAYTQPFCDFLTENPTVWHAVEYFEKKLQKAGFKKVFPACSKLQAAANHHPDSYPSGKPGSMNWRKEASTMSVETEVA